MIAALAIAVPQAAAAQESTTTEETRAAVITKSQTDKAATLHPYVPSAGERLMTKVEDIIEARTRTWHPFFENAYRGGGFALGLGYMWYVSPYSYMDVRGSYSIRSYKRAEVEFVSPRLFHRRGELSVVGGWRDATQVAFYGFGTNTLATNRANFGFELPYASAVLTVRPTRRLLLLQGGLELARWDLKSGTGGRSIEDLYSPQTLPGLGTSTDYLHTQATVGFDWRPSGGYARRGGFYAVTAHDYNDRDETLGFRRVDYEVVQHLPILRETWVISLHGLAETTWDKGDQQVPFFLMPSLGGGSNLRGYSSWRFRDRHSLLLQAEWRIMVNRFLDTAVFYDTGKVAARSADLDFNDLKSDYGFGVRFHTPFATVLRIDVARSREGTTLVFATSAPF